MIDLLTQEELENIRQDVKDVLSDVQYENHIIYRRIVSRTVDLGTGLTVINYDETELHAVVGDMTAREVANSGGAYQIGDVFVMYPPGDMDTIPRSDDRILRLITGAGDVKLDFGSANVVGYNTRFLLDGVLGGDLLKIDVSGVPVFSTLKGTITDDAAAVLKDAWANVPMPATEFKIYRQYEIVQRIVDPLKAVARLVIRRLGS